MSAEDSRNASIFMRTHGHAIKWAVDKVSALIEDLIKDQRYEADNSSGGCLIVGYLPKGINPEGEYELLEQRDYGDKLSWDYPFDEIAMLKGRITARTGKSSREVLTKRPDLLDDTDVMWWGSYLLDPIFFSFSGFEEPTDYELCKSASGLYVVAKSKEYADKRKTAEKRGGLTFEG